jgi:hypothetical protein
LSCSHARRICSSGLPGEPSGQVIKVPQKIFSTSRISPVGKPPPARACHGPSGGQWAAGRRSAVAAELSASRRGARGNRPSSMARRMGLGYCGVFVLRKIDCRHGLSSCATLRWWPITDAEVAWRPGADRFFGVEGRRRGAGRKPSKKGWESRASAGQGMTPGRGAVSGGAVGLGSRLARRLGARAGGAPTRGSGRGRRLAAS